MKRILLVCTTVLILFSGFALADPAAVIDDFGCNAGIPNLEGGLFDPFIPLSTTESHKVITARGVAILTCHFTHDEYLPYATSARDFNCLISGVTNVPVLADESRIVATPGGTALMVCKIKNS